VTSGVAEKGKSEVAAGKVCRILNLPSTKQSQKKQRSSWKTRKLLGQRGEKKKKYDCSNKKGILEKRKNG